MLEIDVLVVNALVDMYVRFRNLEEVHNLRDKLQFSLRHVTIFLFSGNNS